MLETGRKTFRVGSVIGVRCRPRDVAAVVVLNKGCRSCFFVHFGSKIVNHQGYRDDFSVAGIRDSDFTVWMFSRLHSAVFEAADGTRCA